MNDVSTRLTSGRWLLPESWCWAKGRDFAEIIGGGTPKNASDPVNYSEDGFPWITPADLSGYGGTYIERGARSLSSHGLKHSSARIMPSGTVLFTSRAPVGYCVIARNSVATNQGFKSFVAHKETVPEYLRYYLLASKDYAEQEASGTTFRELSGAAAGSLLFAIAPLNEQQRVVAKIDELFSELDAGVASLKRARALLKKYRQAVLKAAVTGELTRDWRERHRGQIEQSGADLLQRILKARREAWEAAELKKLRAKGKPPKDDRWKQKYKEPQPPDANGLPALPEGWVWVSLDQLITLITSGSRGWRDYYSNSGSLFIRAQNLKNDALNLSDAAYVDLPGRTEGVRTRVMEDDILVTITGANVTKSALVNRILPEAYVSQHVGLVRLAIRDCATFVHSWIICPNLGRKYLLGAAYGAGKPGLNLDNLRELVLALPPLEEQYKINERIDEIFSNLDSFNLQISTQAHHSGNLRQSILKAAFAGKLVPQDPNDEPASVLLERIRAERAARPKPARGRRTGGRRKRSDGQLDLALDRGDAA